MRVVLCDDEQINLKVNKIYLDEFFKSKGIEKYQIAMFTEYNETLNNLIEKKLIDIAILDIDIKDGNINGMDMAKKIHAANKDTIIVFITSHPEFALDAFSVAALGFISKPYSKEEFFDQFEKVFVQYQGVQSLKHSKIVLRFGDQFVDASEIYFLEKEKNKLLIHMKEETISERLSLYKIAPQLPDYFIKIERGIYVNAYYISKISSERIHLTDGMSFHIPDRQKKRIVTEYHNLVELYKNQVYP